uniref:Secreted protein n=1 Tax=Alexandrium monilatum TaxID=311494 RepID=A0A6T1L2V0_9DINO
MLRLLLLRLRLPELLQLMGVWLRLRLLCMQMSRGLCTRSWRRAEHPGPGSLHYARWRHVQPVGGACNPNTAGSSGQVRVRRLGTRCGTCRAGDVLRCGWPRCSLHGLELLPSG